MPIGVPNGAAALPPCPLSFEQELRNIRAMFGYLHSVINSFQVKISIYYILFQQYCHNMPLIYAYVQIISLQLKHLVR